jgi:hypothetical protein
VPALIGALLAALLQAATGLLLSAWVFDLRGQVTRGFLLLTSGIAFVLGVLVWGLGALARLEGPEHWLHVGLVAGSGLYALLLSRESRSPRLQFGGLGLAAGLLGLSLAAFARPSGLLGEWLTVVAYLASALAVGGGVSAMLLGHWYLVTPGLTARELRLQCDLLLASLVPLAALSAWFLWRASGGQAIGGLSGPALWLGAGMITLFPIGVTAAARVCCVDGPGRGRSIQAATGLLYLVSAAVLAGGLAGNAVLLGA